MPSKIYLRDTLHIGIPKVYECPAPSTAFMVVFEDDGETGYLYGLDGSRADQPILDALHIYNVSGVTDKDSPATVEIAWTDDGLKVCLIINRYPHAIFDFEAKRAYCRNNFPPPDPAFTTSHQWDENVLELFK